MQLSILCRDGTRQLIEATKAFTLFGHDFYAHRSVGFSREKYWTITHGATTASACDPVRFKTKAEAVRETQRHLEIIGEAALLKAIGNYRPVTYQAKTPKAKAAPLKTRTSLIDFEALLDAHQSGEQVGACTECGHIQDGVEPDAQGYRCENCGLHAVTGAELLLLAEV
jgi:hypothetical protein